jgi:putative peptidoglycan lipid II flippase
MGTAALVVSGSVLASRLLGLGRESLLAAMLGVSAEGDIYRDAFVIPDLLNYLLAGGFLSITLIPILARRLEAGDTNSAWADFTVIFRWVGLLVVVSTGLLYLVAPSLTRLAFPKIGPESLEAVTALTRVALPAQVFFVLGSLFMAAQYAHRRFLVPALAPVVYNLGIIGGGLLGGGSPDGFVWGAVAGAVVGNFALQWWGAHRLGMRWNRTTEKGILGKYFALALPLMIGQSVAVLDEQFPRIFGQLAGDGGTSALSFARMLNMLPVGMIAQAAGVASYPFLAHLAARQSWEEMTQTTVAAARTTLVAAAGAAAVVIAVARPAVRTVYQWGVFAAADTQTVAPLLVVFAYSIPAWGLHQILARSFYARERMWSPVLIGTAGTALAIPLSIGLHQRMGLAGLALASTVVMWLYALALGLAWQRATASARFGDLLVWMGRLAIPTAAAAAAGRLVSNQFSMERLSGAVAAAIAGTAAVVVVYGALGRLLGVRGWR